MDFSIEIPKLDRLPFPGKPHSGRQYKTLFIKPPIFLQAISSELRERNVTFTKQELRSELDVLALPQKFAVNCTGLGSRTIYNDNLLTGNRGQLVHLKPKALPYLLIHHDGYIFPRTDALVLGGTFEAGIEDATPDPLERQAIIDRNRRFFFA